ncbi:MAG: glycoside hydrolase family 38 C-terminal domain-containing protein [Promethearchaeota archaeon]
MNKLSEDFKIVDSVENEIDYQYYFTEEEPRFTLESNVVHRVTFLVKVPACGYKIYNLVSGEKAREVINEENTFKLTKNTLENEFYQVKVENDGHINVLDKKSGIWHENMCYFEDHGDWGDEYDFSGPQENQTDFKYTTGDGNILEIVPLLNGPTQKTIHIKMGLRLPRSLSKDRYIREENLVNNRIDLYISLYKGINRIDFKIELENNCKDHRIRVLFPSKIKTDKVYCDGHFHVVPREIKIPEGKRWAQKPLPTNHQKDFTALSDGLKCFAVLNKGLPEYEAIKNEDETITLAITLLRCIEWLSRGDFITRKSNAGPDLKTPGAQCLGKHEFELSLIIENNKPNWLEAEIHIKGKEFNNPLKPIFPLMANSPLRVTDKVFLNASGVLSYFKKSETQQLESYLPTEMSFLEVSNKNVMLSALKKSEEGDFLVVRCYNISTIQQRAILKFNDSLSIKNAEIVNFLEEKPSNEINAQVNLINSNNIELSLEPHVIATLKITIFK